MTTEAIGTRSKKAELANEDNTGMLNIIIFNYTSLRSKITRLFLTCGACEAPHSCRNIEIPLLGHF